MNETRVTCISAQGAERELPFADLVTPDLADQARTDTNTWIKRLRLVPYGGVSMRERFRYRDDSLWWFTELYLQKMRQLDQAVLTVLALDHARAQHAPARLVIAAPDATTIAAARAPSAPRAACRWTCVAARPRRHASTGPARRSASPPPCRAHAAS